MAVPVPGAIRPPDEPPPSAATGDHSVNPFKPAGRRAFAWRAALTPGFCGESFSASNGFTLPRPTLMRGSFTGVQVIAARAVISAVSGNSALLTFEAFLILNGVFNTPLAKDCCRRSRYFAMLWCVLVSPPKDFSHTRSPVSLRPAFTRGDARLVEMTEDICF